MEAYQYVVFVTGLSLKMLMVTRQESESSELKLHFLSYKTKAIITS